MKMIKLLKLNLTKIVIGTVFVTTAVTTTYFYFNNHNNNKTPEVPLYESFTTDDKEVIDEIYDDTLKLHNLLKSFNFCDDKNFDSLKSAANIFSNYEYTGENKDIVEIVNNYNVYGDSLLKIIELISNEKIEDAQTELNNFTKEAEEYEKQLFKVKGV